MNTTEIKHADISSLANHSSKPCVSIYLPTHRKGREIQQDPIRLKNLLADAEKQLQQAGHDRELQLRLLAPAQQLPGRPEDDFWQNSTEGLAILLSPGSAVGYRLTAATPELVVVADEYYLPPLLRSLQGDGRCYALAVSQNRVRLFEGDKHGLSEVEHANLPQDLVDALNIDEYQSALQFHSHAAATSSSAGGDAIFHGHGGGEGEDHKKELLQFFHRLNAPLMKYLSGQRAPLVFCGVEYLFPLFREACDYQRLVAEPAPGNPDDLSADDLHPRVWQLVEPLFAADQRAIAERLGLAESRDQGSRDLDAIASAAEQGRVDTLYVRADLADGPGQQRQRCAGVVSQVLRTGGDVLVCDAEPDASDSGCAAVYRY